MSFKKEYCREIEADPRGEKWSAGAREHIAGCPACTAFLESCALLETRLKDLPSSREEMPAKLREHLLQQLSDDTIAQAPPGGKSLSILRLPTVRRFMIPTALAAALVLGIFLEKTFDFGSTYLPVEVDKTIGMYISDVTHDSFLLERVGRPLEIEISDPGDLSDWLSASLNFDFRLPADGGSLELQGGRVWHTVGRLSALASYTTASGSRVVLFAVPAENLKPSGAESGTIGTTRVFTGHGWGYEARVWIDGDLALALTAPEGELPDAWDEVFLP